jgi:hypothetical protein
MDKVYNVFNEIKQNNPNLVARLLERSQRPDSGETIYGEVVDWVTDMYSEALNLDERDELIKRLIADFVIHHPYCLQKVYIVLQESNVDGELIINPVPCMSLEAAKKVLADEKRTILRESYHFGGRDLDDFEVEDEDEHFYINDPCDDYHEDITIVEKNIAL